MSNTTGEELVLAKMRRDNAETEKRVAEARRFFAEHDKLRLGADRLLAPWLAIVGLIGGVISIVVALACWKGGG